MFTNLKLKRSYWPDNSFAEKVLKALNGEKGIVEPTFVYLPGVPGGEAIAKETGLDFFSVPVELGVSLFPRLIEVEIKEANYHIDKRCRKSSKPSLQH